MATLKGRAVVYSVGGITFSAGIVGSHFTQSVRLNRSANKADIIDDGGSLRTHVFHGFKKILSLTVIPCDAGTSLGGAQTSMNNHMPANGTTITVVDSNGTIIDGSYNCISSTQGRSVDGVASIDLEMEQGDEGVSFTTAVA